MKEVNVVNATRPLPVPLRAGYCVSFLCKLRGLSFRSFLPDDWGLLMAYPRDSRADSAIHMLGMRFDLAVIWVNTANHVVDVRHARRWSPLIVPRLAASCVLEAGLHWLEHFEIGDEVSFA